MVGKLIGLTSAQVGKAKSRERGERRGWGWQKAKSHRIVVQIIFPLDISPRSGWQSKYSQLSNINLTFFVAVSIVSSLIDNSSNSRSKRREKRIQFGTIGKCPKAAIVMLTQKWNKKTNNR